MELNELQKMLDLPGGAEQGGRRFWQGEERHRSGLEDEGTRGTQEGGACERHRLRWTCLLRCCGRRSERMHCTLLQEEMRIGEELGVMGRACKGA